MNRAHWLRSLSQCGLASLAVCLVISCTKAEDTQDYVPSQQGATQPDAGGAELSEATACTQLTSAETSARKSLGCTAVTHECPSYIRPAGGADCFTYSKASVDACSDLFDTFTSCDDFAQHPCLVSAISHCDEPVTGEAGAGGAPSDTPSEAGAAGVAGTTDAAGAGGA